MSGNRDRRGTDFKLIENKNVRRRVLENRKKNLLKLAEELSIPCDVNLLVLICGLDEQNPELWPSNVEEATKLLNRFKKHLLVNGNSRKDCDIFPTKKKQTGEKFPTSDHKSIINQLNQMQLQNVCDEFDTKFASVMNVSNSIKAMTEGPRMLVDQGTGFLNKEKEKKVFLDQEHTAIRQYQGFQPNWIDNPLAEGPRMFLDHGTGLLNKGKEKHTVVYQEPVATQQNQFYQPSPMMLMQNRMTYPVFAGSSSSSINAPNVPLLVHQVLPVRSSMSYSIPSDIYNPIMPGSHSQTQTPNVANVQDGVGRQVEVVNQEEEKSDHNEFMGFHVASKSNSIMEDTESGKR